MDYHRAESAALHRRAEKYEKMWQPHWRQCHELLQNRLQSLGQVASIAVLGSGTLRETPLELLKKYCQEVILVDIHHHAQTQKFLAQEKNLRFRSLDLNTQKPDFAADFWISANVLSQLPRHRTDLILRKDFAGFLNYRRQVQARHVDFLFAQKKPFLLWSDDRICIMNRKGQCLEEETSVELASDWKVLKKWDWNLVPMSWYRRHSIVLKMFALSEEKNS